MHTKNKIKNSSILIVLALNLVFRIFTDASLYLFTLPITIPISILIYYLINVYKGKNKNITVDKPIKETEKLPLNQIPFNKSKTLRILISISAALLILFTLSFFDFWIDLLGGNDWFGSVNLIFYSSIIYPFLAYIIHRFLPKDLELYKFKLNALQVALLITFIIIVLFLLLLIFFSG